jgi:hypothetical protein
MYLSAGKDAAHKRFYRLELKGLLERKVEQAAAQ